MMLDDSYDLGDYSDVVLIEHQNGENRKKRKRIISDIEEHLKDKTSVVDDELINKRLKLLKRLESTIDDDLIHTLILRCQKLQQENENLEQALSHLDEGCECCLFE